MKNSVVEKSALDAFVGCVGEIQERLSELSELAGDHLGVAPDSVNWGNVGSAQRVLSELTALSDWLFKRGEYAE